MTVAERLRQEGLEEGRDKVLEEGEMIRSRKIAINAIIKGYSTKDVVDITELTEKEVDDIRAEML